MPLANKWSADLGIELDLNGLKGIIKNTYTITNVPKYRSFQFQLMHRTIVTNIHLHKWGIVSSDECYYCELYRESVVHLFFSCHVIHCMWEKIKSYVETVFGQEFILTKEAVITNRVN